MIKQKGVCDECGKEFEINGGCFAISLNVYSENPKIMQMNIYKNIFQAPEDYVHLCGKQCLYKFIDKEIDVNFG
jgi:hypothetical protein